MAIGSVCAADNPASIISNFISAGTGVVHVNQSDVDNHTNVNNHTDNKTTNMTNVTNDTNASRKTVSDVKDNSTTNTTNAINNTDVPAAGEPPMKSPAKPAVETHLEKTGLPIVALVLVVLAAVGLYRRD